MSRDAWEKTRFYFTNLNGPINFVAKNSWNCFLLSLRPHNSVLATLHRKNLQLRVSIWKNVFAHQHLFQSLLDIHLLHINNVWM